MTELRLALDTNLLVYAEGVAPHERDAHKPAAVRELLRSLPRDGIRVPVQVLGELYRVLVGKAGRTPQQARAAIMGWRDGIAVLDTTEAVMLAAADLAADHGLSIWDAVVLASAADAGCRLVLSEDMQDGFSWRGLTIASPFAEEPHPLLAAVVGS